MPVAGYESILMPTNSYNSIVPQIKERFIIAACLFIQMHQRFHNIYLQKCSTSVLLAVSERKINQNGWFGEIEYEGVWDLPCPPHMLHTYQQGIYWQSPVVGLMVASWKNVNTSPHWLDLRLVKHISSVCSRISGSAWKWLYSFTF